MGKVKSRMIEEEFEDFDDEFETVENFEKEVESKKVKKQVRKEVKRDLDFLVLKKRLSESKEGELFASVFVIDHKFNETKCVFGPDRKNSTSDFDEEIEPVYVDDEDNYFFCILAETEYFETNFKGQTYSKFLIKYFEVDDSEKSEKVEKFLKQHFANKKLMLNKNRETKKGQW